jgi:hypothetical protein
MDEAMATGAVVAGRGTVPPAGWWDGDHHDGVPIFILTTTRTSGVGCAAAALSAGVLDEVQLHLVPTILGEGRRLFEGIGPEPHQFELIPRGRGPR